VPILNFWHIKMLKTRSFLPGRACIKKGLPLLGMVRARVTRRNSGLSNSKAMAAERWSRVGLVNELYKVGLKVVLFEDVG
jgi:hypothetical protein